MRAQYIRLFVFICMTIMSLSEVRAGTYAQNRGAAARQVRRAFQAPTKAPSAFQPRPSFSDAPGGTRVALPSPLKQEQPTYVVPPTVPTSAAAGQTKQTPQQGALALKFAGDKLDEARGELAKATDSVEKIDLKLQKLDKEEQEGKDTSFLRRQLEASRQLAVEHRNKVAMALMVFVGGFLANRKQDGGTVLSWPFRKALELYDAAAERFATKVKEKLIRDLSEVPGEVMTAVGEGAEKAIRWGQEKMEPAQKWVQEQAEKLKPAQKWVQKQAEKLKPAQEWAQEKVEEAAKKPTLISPPNYFFDILLGYLD